MPRGEVVRSLSLPKTGLATIASSEPTPVTSARPPAARPAPTTGFTFSASVTSSGATSIRDVPM
jgi:hypothetical protein